MQDIEVIDLPGTRASPQLVLLHEGLGSVGLWRDFPQRLVRDRGCSSYLGAGDPLLIGHSDGASIALIHAATHPVQGVVAIAPHVFVEDLTLGAIEATVRAFDAGELRERMARHHDDPELASRGWADVWLDPRFRDWDLRPLLPRSPRPSSSCRATTIRTAAWRTSRRSPRL